MPTIGVDKYALFKELGQTFTPDEFQDLMFEFGLELDEDTEDDPARPADEPPQLKIEIPANRYDMLCFEGIVMNLNVFRKKRALPNFRLLDVPQDKMQTIVVKESTTQIRPFVAGAILRNVTFTKERYESFIALQDKLHQNLARQRTLVAIGTHDLDTVQGPFTYDARSPKDISFVPLNQEKKMNGEELMAFYDKDKHLGRYLHIIRDSPVYPVISDSKGTVCSLPPIINGNHSKISLNTKNVFIEATATDATKLAIVIDMMVTMFACYCAEPFVVEPMKIVSEHNSLTRVTPDLSSRKMEVSVAYLNACTGLDQSPDQLCKLLEKMAYTAKPAPDAGSLEVQVPVTRPDVLHACDIMEDVAISYGFNSLPRMNANKSATIGRPLPINKLGDIVRTESAMAGWSEVMPLILISHDENFAWLNRKDDGKTAVKLANPKSLEYQVARTSLLPGLLKTIRENKAVKLPLKIFECADVVFKDESLERKARNERHYAAAYLAKSSGLEEIHGLLDRVMQMLSISFLLEGDKSATEDGYYIEGIEEPTFFPGRAAAIHLRQGGKAKRIGEFGVLHPQVLEKFELKNPISTLELNLEPLL